MRSRPRAKPEGAQDNLAIAGIGEGWRVPKRHSQAYEWTLVISLALVFGFVGLNRAGIAFVIPPIVQEFHLEFWQAGLLVSGTSAHVGRLGMAPRLCIRPGGTQEHLAVRHVRGVRHLVPYRPGLELRVVDHPARHTGTG